jgi:hypothetical protein
MTDEATQSAVESNIVESVEAQSQPANDGVNISVEQILAAIINNAGEITVPLESLIANYSDKTISVTQNEDKSVRFNLVDSASVPTQELAE